LIVDVLDGKVSFFIRDNQPTDKIVVKEIWDENVYRTNHWNFFREDTGQEVVVDIGANIGTFSIYAAYYGAKVFAIEPEPNNLESLIKNIELNGMKDLIKPVAVGISDFNGEAVISNEGGDSTILDNKDGSKIKIMSLDSFIKKNKISSIGVLKIDTEGSEVKTILGASKKSLAMCKYIAIEFDKRTGKHLGEMVQKLSETHHVHTMGSWERGGMIFADLY
jgi:FkbM family methyltransferase